MNEIDQNAALNDCGCCDIETPQPVIDNAPGQGRLNYRIGTHATILRRMIQQLSTHRLPGEDSGDRRPLSRLSTRSAEEPVIALLDAWATVGDVITFYQERIANEGYLRTATERRSILELARSIGYELRPGVAAGAYLAFTVDESEQTPDETTVPAGTQVQSIPAKEGELPQTFETLKDFEARSLWNELRPRLSRPQTLTLGSSKVFLKGINLDLAVGDRMLLIERSGSSVSSWRLKRVSKSTEDRKQLTTLVEFEADSAGQLRESLEMGLATTRALASPGPGSGQAGTIGAAFGSSNLNAVLGSSLSESQFQAVLSSSGWQVSNVVDYTKNLTSVGSTSIEVYILRQKSPIFGHNAPFYDTLSDDVRPKFNDWDESGFMVWEDSIWGPVYYADADLYLARPLEKIADESWLILERPDAEELYQVRESISGSMTGFSISAEVTGLRLNDTGGDALSDNNSDKDPDFLVRKTTAYVQSEALSLAEEPISAELKKADTKITLDSLVPGLAIGQPIVVNGEQLDAVGVNRTEVKLIAAIGHSGGKTSLTFSKGLEYSYRRSSVTLAANVVEASHGETVRDEVLGSANGALPHQRFSLRKPPLTYVSSADPSGAESTLEVRVNGVAWRQVDSLYAQSPDARVFVVRIDDDAKAEVLFGDGQQGARPPTGQENVVATYRSGIGSDGEVGGKSLTLMKKRPFGISAVVNPLAASGAADPEKLDDARQNAPLTVLTLERIVSLQDYEDFARAFIGIGKAMAAALWSGESELVHITVADEDGDAVVEPLLGNLTRAIAAARDPLRRVRIGSFQPRVFDLSARVLIDSTLEWESVRSRIDADLKRHFGFAARSFAQAVTSAEVVTAIHGVEGVIAVDLDALFLNPGLGASATSSLESFLPAHAARPGPAGHDFLPAELLTVNPYGITLTRMDDE